MTNVGVKRKRSKLNEPFSANKQKIEKKIEAKIISDILNDHSINVRRNAVAQISKSLMFSLICAWTNGWVNNRDAGHLRRHRAHYDVIIMKYPIKAAVPQVWIPYEMWGNISVL